MLNYGAMTQAYMVAGRSRFDSGSPESPNELSHLGRAGHLGAELKYPCGVATSGPGSRPIDLQRELGPSLHSNLPFAAMRPHDGRTPWEKLRLARCCPNATHAHWPPRWHCGHFAWLHVALGAAAGGAIGHRQAHQRTSQAWQSAAATSIAIGIPDRPAP